MFGKKVLVCCLALSAVGCRSYQRAFTNGEAPRPPARIALLPFANLTEYPHAGEIATELWGTELSARNYKPVPVSPGTEESAGKGNGTKPLDPAEAARTLGVRYVVTGSVTEFRYTFGLDGGPAVGLSAEIFDAEKGSVCWRASASRRGRSGESLSQVAQRVCEELADSIE